MAKDTDAYFLQLILSFSSACMQQLGKIANPITGKIERDLDQARYSIDILRMLKSKTEGNLSDEERKTLDKIIYETQINYVDEFEKEKRSKETEESEKPEKADDSKEENNKSEGKAKTAEEDKSEK